MACMTHECINLNCGCIIMDNTPGPEACPDCGSKMSHSCDEYPDKSDLD